MDTYHAACVFLSAADNSCAVADAGAARLSSLLKSRSRPLVLLASSVLLLMAGCDTMTTPLTEPNEILRADIQALQATEPITGIYSAVVTDATDLNNASFGRDPSEWIGKAVTGIFAIYLATPGIGDRDPEPDAWVFGPVPGPGPFIEFVTVTAIIDGQVFRTSSADYETIFFGDVVSILDSNTSSSFNPQDSFVGVRGQGIGRSIVGFDAFFGPGGVSFDGTSLAIDPALLQFGHGLIDDFLESGATIHRQGTIAFMVTKVSVTRLGALVEKLIELADVLPPDQVAALLDRLYAVGAKSDAGNVRAACNQLAAFTNQVQGLIASGHLTAEAGQSLIAEAAGVRDELEC